MSSTRPLHHVALGARDVDALARFYQDALGLAPVARHLDDQGAVRSIWLESGETLLMVERTTEPPRRVEGIGAGPFLLAFRVGPRERAGLEQTLERAGARIEARSAFSSYFRDPEGNRLAVSHYPEPVDPGPPESGG